MSDQPKGVRIYSEKEVGDILERATELRKSEPGATPDSGMTLAELEEVAVEAGIDVGRVRRAALEVDAGADGPTALSRFLGEELTVTRETILPGEVPERAFEDLLEVLQSAVPDHGQPSLVGRTLAWQGGGADGTRKLRVVVSARDGHTTVLVEENLSQMAGGIFGGLGGGVGLGMGMGFGLPLGLSLGSVAATVAIPVAWLGLTYFGVRRVYQAIVRRRKRAVDGLFARLVEAAQDAIAETTLGSG